MEFFYCHKDYLIIYPQLSGLHPFRHLKIPFKARQDGHSVIAYNAIPQFYNPFCLIRTNIFFFELSK